MINKLVGGPLLSWICRGWLFLTPYPSNTDIVYLFLIRDFMWPFVFESVWLITCKLRQCYFGDILIYHQYFLFIFYHFNLAILSSETVFCRFFLGDHIAEYLIFSLCILPYLFVTFEINNFLLDYSFPLVFICILDKDKYKLPVFPLLWLIWL